jgi:hypothetical protein
VSRAAHARAAISAFTAQKQAVVAQYFGHKINTLINNQNPNCAKEQQRRHVLFSLAANICASAE